VFVVELGRELVIGDDLICGRGFDEVPVAEGKSARWLRSLFRGLQGFIP
jgi:hypothetical protein